MRISILALACTWFLLACGTGAAQEPGVSPSPPPGTPVFRKNVNLVTVVFTVKNKNGALIPNLTQDQFEVTEEGKPQTIKYFSSENNVPLTLGILIDTSESMERVLAKEKSVAGEFLRDILTDKDLAFIISFDLNVDLLEDVTSELTRLQKALGQAATHKPLPRRISGEGPSALPRGTLLYDAVYLGASDVLSKQAGRKAMVIVTDGVDQGSQLQLRDALKAAQQADAVCYVLLLFDPVYGNDTVGMKQLTEQTGGRVISVSDPSRLAKAFAEISRELRSQYSLGYSPTANKHDGKFRHISVKSRNGYKVQARKGYYAPLD